MMSAFEEAWALIKMPQKRYSSKERRLFDREKIPYEEEIQWTRNKYGAKPRTWLLAEDTIAGPLIAAAQERRIAAKQRREIKAQQKQEELEQLANSLNLLPDSQTFKRYLAGEIEEEEARGIGEYMAHRHNDTNYDELLAQGHSKEDARNLMEDGQ